MSSVQSRNRQPAGLREGGQFATGAKTEADVTLTADGPFRFDRDYKNVEQVRPYMDAFLARYDELAQAGQYPYNDSFRGHIPGIEGPDEDTAIYLLQRLRDRDRLDAQREEFIAAGGFEVTVTDLAPGQVLRGTVVHCGYFMGGTGWQQFESARLRAQNGSLTVIEKGKRNGQWLHGKVLIRED
ncbi:hypothetical protein [Pseudactinotalea terrae]|uniref:hypothetical protein n=1 Tax=Pseudactinotalea terrae TaxID=1743262 RepID=UPI0012E32053|nr:hypothetical protein [Pseudactinotalea terrae]